MDTTFDSIGVTPLFEPAFSEPVEDALFVLLLTLVRGPSEEPWEPFAVPWVYSFTSDSFAEPPRAPDPSALTWTLVGDENDEYEIPGSMDPFEFSREDLQETLSERWGMLEVLKYRVGYQNTNFNPLTQHFFIRGYTSQGIDQLIANLCCLEATYLVGKEKRKRLQNRIARLLRNREVNKNVNEIYDFRDLYIHPGESTPTRLIWGDLAKARWATNLAVDAYLKLAVQEIGLDRATLLQRLSDGEVSLPAV